MNFGPAANERESLAMLNEAVDQGINFIDTADVYGWKLGEGITERIIGRWLAEEPKRRERIVLATKAYGPMGSHPNERGLSAYHLRRACDESLRRLKTDRIDVYYLHHLDRGIVTASEQRSFGVVRWSQAATTPPAGHARWDEVWQALEVLVQQGKVLYVATSNHPGWIIAQAIETAGARHFLGPVCEQSPYNLSNRTVELEVIPACREYGVGFVPYSPLAGGLLGGVLEKKERTYRKAELGTKIDVLRPRLEAYEELCRELGAPPAEIATAWLLHQPSVVAPVIGPRSVEQLRSSLPAAERRFDGDALARLEEIWPGPGAEAPEAYAW
jgi:aryl-alcohol dehydrogenase-like predicted oxidoreductase